MKKVDRLRWIEETFGKDFVLPYWACTEWSQIELAVKNFESAQHTWGMRTDLRNGHDQGYQLPFVHHGSMEQARAVFDKHKDALVYIVCENVLVRRLSAVAIKLDAEHVLFEWNDVEPTIAQRQMYNKPENLKQIVLGPSGYFFPWGGAVPLRCVPPEYAAFLKFDGIYDVMIHSDVDETTFTVRNDGKVVVW